MVTQYLCMTIVLFFVYYKPASDLDYPGRRFFQSLGFMSGFYDDFSEGWYDEVGQKLLIPVIMQLVMPHLRNGFPYLITAIKRCRDSGKCCGESESTKQLTQDDYNDLYTGPEFGIAYSYATMLTITFVVMTFSAGMPLLYPMAFLYYLFCYWFDKYLILNFYRKPMTFNEMVPVVSTLSFKYPILLHCIVGITMLSSREIFYKLPGAASTSDAEA